MAIPLRLLMCAILLASPAARAEPDAMLVLQQSPVAGFQHHAGPVLFPFMRVGDPLTLEREADNPYDARAVRVLWRGSQIGYAPRADNVDLARFMDQGTPVEGRILHLQTARDPWKRVLMEILIVADPPKP